MQAIAPVRLAPNTPMRRILIPHFKMFLRPVRLDTNSMRGFRTFVPGLKPEGPTEQPETKRVHGRVFCQYIHSSLGEIVDLSASGARVRIKGALLVGKGDCFTMTLMGINGQAIVACKAIWTAKRGWRKHEVGVQFYDLSAEARKIIAEIGRSAANNESVRVDLIQDNRWKCAG